MIPDGFGSCITDCDAINTMPDLIFTFNGKQFSLTANEYIVKVSMVQSYGLLLIEERRIL